ncbi:MAG: hypothetical protein GX595_21195 [Lentisphaerae bacterium]|nr:hypothetical protein [Lentisphaerota bacterium]
MATEVAISIAIPAGGTLDLSYWDVWYVLLATDRFEGDLNRLALELRELRQGSFASDAAKRKLSHLRDLQQRLARAGIGVSDILAALPPDLARVERRRAYGRIAKHNQRSYELSEAMRTLPLERFCEIARRGLWAPFPVSPQPYYDHLRAEFNWRRCHGEDASWALARKLDAAVAAAKELEDKGTFAEALAALRATLTVTIELVEMADDSFGCIGQSFKEAFNRYLAFPRQNAGIPPQGFLTDLLELLVFEDYGFTDGCTDGFFASLPSEEGDFCLAYLRGRIPALLAWDLDYQAEAALTLIGQIAAEQKRFDSFEALAREMGTREWQPIIRLADAAVRARNRNLADRVFQAALAANDGIHTDFLANKHAQLLQNKWNPDPRK